MRLLPFVTGFVASPLRTRRESQLSNNLQADNWISQGRLIIAMNADSNRHRVPDVC